MGSKDGDKAVTFADVAMRVAHDGPMYAVIVVVGVMAFKGHASAGESIIAGLGALLARSWPRAIQVGGGASAILFMLGKLSGVLGLVLLVSSCSGKPTTGQVRAAEYGAELQLCSARAATLDASREDQCQESIRCENEVRARYPLKDGGARELRNPDAGCN